MLRLINSKIGVGCDDMKRFLSILLIFVLAGCSLDFGGGGKTVYKPQINNTSNRGVLTMSKSLYKSHINSGYDFVVLRLSEDNLEKFEDGLINDSTRYARWIEEGVCYEGRSYKCAEEVMYSRLNIFIGSTKDVRVDSTNAINNTESIAFFHYSELSENISLSTLNSAGGNLENNFRKTIIDNIEYEYINHTSLEYFQVAEEDKVIELGEDDLFVNKQKDEYYFKTLREKQENKESFILLTTSSRGSGDYCIFSDREYEPDANGNYECLEEDPGESEQEIDYTYNICNSRVPFTFWDTLRFLIPFYGVAYELFVDNSMCAMYNDYMDSISGKYGFSYYRINIDTPEKQFAVEEHTLLIGSPQISIFVAGEVSDLIYGLVDDEYIEYRLQTFGVFSTDLQFNIDCRDGEEGTCNFILEEEGETADFDLIFSTLFNSKYFISDNSDLEVTVENYEAIYEGNHMFKDAIVRKNGQITRNIQRLEIPFEQSGTYYIHVYSEDALGNKGVARFSIDVEMVSP